MSNDQEPRTQHQPSSDHTVPSDQHTSNDQEPSPQHQPSSDHTVPSDQHTSIDQEPSPQHQPSSDHTVPSDQHTSIDQEPSPQHQPSSDHTVPSDQHTSNDQEPSPQHQPSSDHTVPSDQHTSNDQEPSPQHQPSSDHTVPSDQHTSNDREPSPQHQPSSDHTVPSDQHMSNDQEPSQVSHYQQQSSDELFMRRALELAAAGVGSVSPNPMVGAVVVYRGEIVGEGWHQRYGEAHAEVNAIAAVTQENLLGESTIYVTLEPCSHWGKTPPCCDLIISKRIKRVVVGCVDPYHEVQGGGIARMREAGIEVTVGILEKECTELNKRFFTAHTLNRPYIILKWAQTSDGFIDVVRPATTPPAWMTGGECRKLVHQWRAQEDAIMVGRRTVEMDNPSLTVREVKGENPIRITLDRQLLLDPGFNIFDDSASTILFTSQQNKAAAEIKFTQNRRVEVEGIDYSQPVMPQVINAMQCRRVHSLMVEGGTQLLQSFIDADLWDEAHVFISPMSHKELYPLISTISGICAPQIGNHPYHSTIIDRVKLRTYQNL